MMLLRKEAERLSKKQKTFREAQMEKLGEMCRLVDEARTELEGIGASLCCCPQFNPPPSTFPFFCSVSYVQRRQGKQDPASGWVGGWMTSLTDCLCLSATMTTGLGGDEESMEVDGAGEDEASLSTTQEVLLRLKSGISAVATALGDGKSSQTAISKFGKQVDKTMPPDLGKAVRAITMDSSLVNKVIEQSKYLKVTCQWAMMIQNVRGQRLEGATGARGISTSDTK